jgi:hypothetical protein
MANITITAQRCNLGQGIKVEIEIDEMGIFIGTKAKIERRFSGNNSATSRYLAAKYIRDIRKLWRDGLFLDAIEGTIA